MLILRANSTHMLKFLRGETAIVAAFAAVYIIWGSTYLFNFFAIQDAYGLFPLGG